MGSSSSGYLRLGINARMHETNLVAGVSSLVQNEIQRIDVTATVVAEQQVGIIYTIEFILRKGNIYQL